MTDHSGGMKRLVPLLVLAACTASPAPEFFGARKVEVMRDGRAYSVWFTDKRVEVVRHGYARRGEHEGIRATMVALIPEVTGCKLNERSLTGDSGEMRGSIRCAK